MVPENIMAAEENTNHTPLKNNLIKYKSQTTTAKEPTDSKVLIRCRSEEMTVSRSSLCRFSKKLNVISQQLEPNRAWEINMSSAPKDSLFTLLKFVQSNGDLGILKDLSIDALFGLISLSHCMEMIEIETILFSQILARSKSYSIVAYLWDLAQRYGNSRAVGEIVRFTHEHISAMTLKGFLNVLKWPHVLDLLTGVEQDLPLDDLCVAIVQWLKEDPMKEEHMDLVVRHLDWTRLSSIAIRHLVFSESLFRRILKMSMASKVRQPTPVVQSVVSDYNRSRLQSLMCNGEVLKKHNEELVKKKLNDYATAWKKNLCVKQFHWTNNKSFLASMKSPAFVMVGATRYNSLAIMAYFVKSKTWLDPLDITLEHRRNFGCVFGGGHLYILGGDRGDGHVYNDCVSVDISNATMEKLDHMRYPKEKFGVALTGSELYVLGGLNKCREAVSSAYKYNLSDKYKMWKPIKPMKEKRWHSGVAVDPYGQVIVIGGHSCVCEYFNKQGWIEMASLPNSYRLHGTLAVYWNQHVYAFRCFNPIEVCIFDMMEKGLSIIPTRVNNPKKIISISPAVGNQFWCMNPDGCMFSFCPETSCWKTSSIKCSDMIRVFYATFINEDNILNHITESEN